MTHKGSADIDIICTVGRIDSIPGSIAVVVVLLLLLLPRMLVLLPFPALVHGVVALLHLLLVHVWEHQRNQKWDTCLHSHLFFVAMGGSLAVSPARASTLTSLCSVPPYCPRGMPAAEVAARFHAVGFVVLQSCAELARRIAGSVVGSCVEVCSIA